VAIAKHWLITGVSSGFGRLLAEAALDRGDSVAGTLRRPEHLADFEALAPGRAHGLLLDVTERARIAPAVEEAVARLGSLDILVNNAGYGLLGALEELEDDEIDHVIETNLGGTMYVTRAALPALRQSRGHIVNFSSLAGLVGLPGLSLYCAAKHAVEGLSEALHLELQPFGVKVTLIEPGAFRTNFASGSERKARSPLPLYDDTPAHVVRTAMSSYGGHEPGDPRKAIAAILQMLESPSPPLRLVLGSEALSRVRSKLEAVNTDLTAWEKVSLTTDYAHG
jgi:NAD(P)-dependent dehydrogenase (short-subunit alcohol dehydrogenase family)